LWLPRDEGMGGSSVRPELLRGERWQPRSPRVRTQAPAS
jgi:hypothetical protein